MEIQLLCSRLEVTMDWL